MCHLRHSLDIRTHMCHLVHNLDTRDTFMTPVFIDNASELSQMFYLQVSHSSGRCVAKEPQIILWQAHTH